MLVVQAPAKINLSLEVVGKRPDGYHELVSIMQTISLADRLTISPSTDLTLTCSDPGLSTSQNLVLEAAALLQACYSATGGCRLHLEKHIPAGAGLGGGSSDGAATLVALTRVWNLPADCADLLALSERLGSDVPFFLYGGTALVEGRGERVWPLPDPERAWYLLVKPPFEVSTARIFAALPLGDWSNGVRTRSVASTIRSEGNVELGVNGLQETLFRLYPEARACFDAVYALAPDRTLVSGSGPTVVARFSSRQGAVEAAALLGSTSYWMQIATPYTMEGWQTPCN